MTTSRRPARHLFTARYCGPADRAQGEHRGRLVTVLAERGDDEYRVRFPCGTESTVSANHLNPVRP